MDPQRVVADSLFRAALAAVDPEAILRRVAVVEEGFLVLRCGPLRAGASRGYEPLRLRLPLRLLGAGKAAGRMALGCCAGLGERDRHGVLIVNDGVSIDLPNIEVFAAGHPLPDGRGAAATQRLLQVAQEPHRGDTLFLISGGASSLMVAPRPPLTLADKVRTTELLLRCGAEISELNTVRKHLSQVKGGGLLQRLNCKVVTIAISDVVGDPPELIGSGPTVADPSTFDEVSTIFDRYRLQQQVPRPVRALIERGCQGLEPETLKPTAALAAISHYSIVASNRLALAGAAVAARQEGWEVEVEPEPLVGDTTAAARAFAVKLLDRAARHRPLCVLAGGETTVTVRGPGRGGRNQEFALAMVPLLASSGITVLSAGSDGIDGPTDAAGAYVDGATAARAAARGLAPQAALAANDSHSFFAALGDLMFCGPTGTNVMDIKIAVIP